MAAPKVINISKHVLVPHHKILSQEEALELLNKYNISELQLPTIKLADAMVKEIKAKLGDIIRIERDGPTGTYFHYRRVVE